MINDNSQLTKLKMLEKDFTIQGVYKKTPLVSPIPQAKLNGNIYLRERVDFFVSA